MATQRDKRPGKDRPTFAASFPRVPELDALVDAFVRGDYQLVRTEAPKVAAQSEDEEVKRAAALLRARTDADPLAIWLLALTALILVFLSGWWVTHGKQPARSRAPAPPPAVTVERVP
jgi:hypothetical protein